MLFQPIQWQQLPWLGLAASKVNETLESSGASTCTFGGLFGLDIAKESEFFVMLVYCVVKVGNKAQGILWTSAI